MKEKEILEIVQKLAIQQYDYIAEIMVLRTFVFELCRQSSDFEILKNNLLSATSQHTVWNMLSKHPPEVKDAFDKNLQFYVSHLNGLSRNHNSDE